MCVHTHPDARTLSRDVSAALTSLLGESWLSAQLALFSFPLCFTHFPFSLYLSSSDSICISPSIDLSIFLISFCLLSSAACLSYSCLFLSLHPPLKLISTHLPSFHPFIFSPPSCFIFCLFSSLALELLFRVLVLLWGSAWGSLPGSCCLSLGTAPGEGWAGLKMSQRGIWGCLSVSSDEEGGEGGGRRRKCRRRGRDWKKKGEEICWQRNKKPKMEKEVQTFDESQFAGWTVAVATAEIFFFTCLNQNYYHFLILNEITD